MEDNNNNISKQPPEKPVYQTLGKKVFWLYFLQTSSAGFIILLISLIIFVLSFQPVLVNSVLGNMQRNASLISLILFIISLVIIGAALATSWLTYINYTFLMADDSFKIRIGFLNKQENAIPYRQIQNVDIERSFMFQMLGLSKLIILTAGHEDKNPKGPGGYPAEAEGIIPAIDQKLASWLQSELLRRADIQKTVQVNGPNY